MTDQKKPETVEDADLDQAQGGGVFGTPAGGWGVAENDQQAQQTVSNVLKNRTQSSGNSVCNIN